MAPVPAGPHITATEFAGAFLWGCLIAAIFLWLLQRDLARIVVGMSDGHLWRATLRVLSTAVALVLVGIVNCSLIPLAIVGFAAARYVMLWQIGGYRGH